MSSKSSRVRERARRYQSTRMSGVTSPSNAWCRIAAILLFSWAGLAEKPTLVFAHPADCARPCEAFMKSVAHPAMQRRLEAVTFETEIAEDKQGPSIAIKDPSGLAVMRWYHMPDWQTLSEILALVDHAAPHLLEAHRATIANEPFIVERERALMALAFGDKIRGRKRLEAMLTSESIENRELAAIWLERLNAIQPGATVRDDIFAQHARQGSSDRARFEAWMALGDIRVVQER